MRRGAGELARALPILSVCVLLWTLAPAADPTTFEAVRDQLNERGFPITVAPGRWGQADTEDIDVFLYSTPLGRIAGLRSSQPANE
jgi:hypothetical protein